MMLVGIGVLGAVGYFMSQSNQTQNPPPRQSASASISDSSKKVAAPKKEDNPTRTGSEKPIDKAKEAPKVQKQMESTPVPSLSASEAIPSAKK